MYSSYSIWKTGHDVSGRFLPLSINLDNSFSPVYIYADAPFVGLFGLTPFWGRFPYALFSILCIPLLYVIAKELVKNELVALTSAFFLAISPWHIQLSRGALDADFALFFYLAGIFVFIKYINKSGVFLSLAFFLLGFYSYHATKIFFVALVLLLLFYYRDYFIKKKFQAVLFLSGVVLIVLSFVYIINTQNVTRQQLLFWNNTDIAARIVNSEREYSNAPRIFKDIFSNKILYFLRLSRENYLEAFSPQFLFLYGEPSGLKKQFSFISSGELYIIELPFLIAGILFLMKPGKNRLILLLLLISPIPSLFSIDRSYVNRSIMMLPFLEIIVGCGVFSMTTHIFKQRTIFQYIFMSFSVGILLFLFSEYLYTYYFRYPFDGYQAWRTSSKDLAQYVMENHNKYKKVYIDGAEKMFLLQFGVFDKIDPAQIHNAWENFNNSPQIGNIYFINVCKQPQNKYKKIDIKEKNTLLIAEESCYDKGTHPFFTINDKGDTLHVIWRIFKT